MRVLLDPENDEQPPEKDNFLEQFYGEPMDRLVQPLADHPPMGAPTVEPCRVRARTLGVIVELLCFCVQHHGYRIKFYVLKHNVVAKVRALCQGLLLVLVCMVVVVCCCFLKLIFVRVGMQRLLPVSTRCWQSMHGCVCV